MIRAKRGRVPKLFVDVAHIHGELAEGQGDLLQAYAKNINSANYNTTLFVCVKPCLQFISVPTLTIQCTISIDKNALDNTTTRFSYMYCEQSMFELCRCSLEPTLLNTAVVVVVVVMLVEVVVVIIVVVVKVLE